MPHQITPAGCNSAW